MAVPYFKLTDTTPADGYPEKITVSFRIYAIGTNDLKYTTPAKIFLTPVIPAGCTPGNNFEFDWNPGFSRRSAQLNNTGTFVGEGLRMHLGLNMELDCYDGANWVWNDSASVYSANLSGVAALPGNPVESWAKNFAGRFLVGLNGIDTNNDLVTDQLTLTTAQGPEGAENITVFVVNGGDGSLISTNNYAFIR